MIEYELSCDTKISKSGEKFEKIGLGSFNKTHKENEIAFMVVILPFAFILTGLLETDTKRSPECSQFRLPTSNIKSSHTNTRSIDNKHMDIKNLWYGSTFINNNMVCHM